ncbi:MAG: hypothetical protein H6721_33315 [Sandaracinus sp.]|nr:hypothetical protein [Sandaracinus sp.]MCB9637014.1 hypothetical protein [Sandaracinus sp.]
MERQRAELRRLRADLPSLRPGVVVVAVGGGLAFGTLVDFLRRSVQSMRAGWDDEDNRGLEHSWAARVLGALGTGLVLTGFALWGRRVRARRPSILEIRRLETLLYR